MSATGLAKRQRVTIRLDGRTAFSGRADSTGTVSTTVRFAGAVKSGTRQVRVVGTTAAGKRTYTVSTRVRYVLR